jgi:hypothetical protein
MRHRSTSPAHPSVPKRRLAGAYAADRAAYTEGKMRFVERVLAAATSGSDVSRNTE